jgi:hypothetical protein
MNRQMFLAAGMLTMVGMASALALWFTGRRKAAIIAGALFLGGSGALMMYFAQLALRR